MMSSPLPLLTASLRLRPYEEADFGNYFRLAGDPEVTRYLLWGPRDEASAREAFKIRLDSAKAGYDGPNRQFVITLPGGSFVGEVGLLNIDSPHRSAEIGYILDPAFNGKGYAAEAGRALLRHAFEDMSLHRVYARCDDRNLASARVMEKMGMRREAHHLSATFYKGEWSGGFVYAILEDEWRAQTAR